MTEDQRTQLSQAFTDGEASVRLEGLEPSAHYYSVKESVLSGQISLEDGDAAIRSHYRPRLSPSHE